MTIDILTLFPEMFEVILSQSIIGRARKKNLISIFCHQIRDFAYDRHKRVDDTPYGGGKGMLMMAEPIYQCFENICRLRKVRPSFIYMSPKGQILNQEIIKKLSKIKNIAILCGHYEGVDQRLIDRMIDLQLSIGDYVLTGGEIPGLVLVDSISRLIPGVLSDSICFEDESHFNKLLEYPQYTKPHRWRGMEVPEVLISGHHENIKKWKREKSILETKKLRPDMFIKFKSSQENK